MPSLEGLDGFERPTAHDVEPTVFRRNLRAALEQLHGRETLEALQRQRDLERGYRQIADEAEKAIPVVERAIPLLESEHLQEGRAWAGTLRSAIKALKGDRGDTIEILSALVTVDDDTASARSEFATAVSNLKGLFEQLAKAKGPANPELLAAIGQLRRLRDGLSATLNELGSARADLYDFSVGTVADEGSPYVDLGRRRLSMEESPTRPRKLNGYLDHGLGI